MVLKCSQNIHAEEFSEIRPFHLCKNRGLGMCRRTWKSIAHHSPEAELRSRRQGWWVRGGEEVCTGKESSLDPRLSAVTLSPKHTLLANPSAAAFDLGFICGCCVFRNLSVCQIRHGFHIQLPLGSGSYWGGGSPGYHMEHSFWLAPAHGILLPYEPHHLLGVMNFVIDDLLFWNDLSV